MNSITEYPAEKLFNIAKFVDSKGRIMQFPAKTSKCLPVLQYLTSKLEKQCNYTEKEINELLKPWCVLDYMLARRMLVDCGYLLRTPNGASYWIAQDIPQQWAWVEKTM